MDINCCSSCQENVVCIDGALVSRLGTPCTNPEGHDTAGSSIATALWGLMQARKMLIEVRERQYSFSHQDGELLLVMTCDFPNLARDPHPAEVMQSACFLAKNKLATDSKAAASHVDWDLVNLLRDAQRR